MTMADRIVLLREGQIEQVGAPLDLFEHPATKYVAGFLGSPSMNFFNATLVAAEGGLAVRLGDGTLLALPAGRRDRLAGKRDQPIIPRLPPGHKGRALPGHARPALARYTPTLEPLHPNGDDPYR